MKITLVVLALFISGICYGQVFGGNPPFVKWKQVNNKAAKVIFPQGLDSTGQRVAAIVKQLDSSRIYPLGNKKGRVSIVLQTQSTISNAYVALGPFRSEFYLTPDQNSFALGSLPWPEQLAIHEYRHVQQNINFNVGLSNAIRIIFGQQGQALANSVVIPDWFYEGDAVFNETNVSRQGRGRLPFFYNDYRALWLENKQYGYMKLRNGSLRDFTPDHYKLGFQLVAYGYEKYGEDFWGKVTRDAASYKGLFYPFQIAVKKYSGKNYSAFRTEALGYVQKNWNDDFKYGSRSKHFIGDYEFPSYAGLDSILFMKSTYKNIPAFTLKTGGKESRIKVRDVSIDNQFSYKNGRIVYSSFRPDIRWGWRNYGELKLIDIHSGNEKRISKKTRYFSPDISENGSTIVAVQVATDGKSALHFIDAGNGMLIKAVPNPENLFFTYPKFYSANEVVSAVRNKEGQMALALTDAAEGETKFLIPFSFNIIAFPSVQHDTIFFSASRGRNDALFAYTTTDKQLYEVGTPLIIASLGKYQPSIVGDRLSWSGFTAEGFKLEEVLKKDLTWKLISQADWAEPTDILYAGPRTFQGFADANRPDNLPVKKYPKASGLVNFHSLVPLVNDPEYSLTLLSENILNTLQTDLTFLYNRNEKFKQVALNGTYGGWFPYINGGVNFNIDRQQLLSTNQFLHYNELEFHGGPQIPLNLSRGKFLTRLNIGTDYVFNQPYITGVYKDSFNVKSFQYLNNYISFSNQIQKARQHIYPHFAQSLVISYNKAIVNSDRAQFGASGYFYFPGLFTNHNLVINAAYQKHDSLRQGTFSNNLPFSRGYSSANFYDMKKLGVNYHLPLLYPDMGFANIIYLQRVRGNLFFDYTHVQDFDRSRNPYALDFRSAGTEIFFDTKWWNMLPVSFGFRYSYLFDQDVFGSSGPHRFEFILPVNLISN